MTVKYRPHRGGLTESLAEAMEFKSLKDLFDYLISDQLIPISIADISVKYWGFDDRCNQELFVVQIKGTQCLPMVGFIYEEEVT